MSLPRACRLRMARACDAHGEVVAAPCLVLRGDPAPCPSWLSRNVVAVCRPSERARRSLLQFRPTRSPRSLARSPAARTARTARAGRGPRCRVVSPTRATGEVVTSISSLGRATAAELPTHSAPVSRLGRRGHRVRERQPARPPVHASTARCESTSEGRCPGHTAGSCDGLE
jgi:hypothetical protein